MMLRKALFSGSTPDPKINPRLLFLGQIFVDGDGVFWANALNYDPVEEEWTRLRLWLLRDGKMNEKAHRYDVVILV